MYNESMKQSFVDNLPTDDLKRMFLSLFKRSEPYETDVGKDILNFMVDECNGLLISLNPKSVGHVGSLKSQFSKYTEWGIENKTITKNYWQLVPTGEDFVKLSFASRNIKDLNQLIEIVEQGLTVSYDRYIIYLLFMGIMGDNFDELAVIEESDVDKINGIITTGRRVYTMPSLIAKEISSNGYYEELKKRDEESKYFIKPYHTKHLLGNPIGYQHVHRVFGKLNKNYNEANPRNQKHFTPMTIWRSGLFYSLYETEVVKGSIVSDDFAYISEIFNNKNTYSSYLRDYELYKKIFWE